MSLATTISGFGYKASILDAILPGSITGVGGATVEDNVDFIISFVGNALTLLLVVVVLLAIVYAVVAGIKYIQSQGASDQVEAARESIKNVVIGLLVAFVGMIVVVIIARIFGVDSDTRQAMICILAPSSAGCP
jgi:cytochrome bd-type quinol oxidase subunit 2